MEKDASRQSALSSLRTANILEQTEGREHRKPSSQDNQLKAVMKYVPICMASSGSH